MNLPNGLTVTHASTVSPDQIDHLGHMNVRYYAANARAATRSLLAGLGVGSSDRAERSDRAGDPVPTDLIDEYTRHHREQLVGSELEVRSGCLSVDADSIRIYHELANATTGELAATFVHRVRSDTPIDHVAIVDLPPHGAPRSLDIDAPPTLPSIDTVRRLDLAIRAPREVDSDDTGGTGIVTPHMLPMLIWGGAAPDGSDHELVHRGPDGENLGWATMETRIVVRRLPRLGTRIQSFGATTAIADKTTSMSMWAFDLDSGDVLITFDVVNLLFNIDSRTAMSIPESMRAESLARFHSELGAQRD